MRIAIRFQANGFGCSGLFYPGRDCGLRSLFPADRRPPQMRAHCTDPAYICREGKEIHARTSLLRRAVVDSALPGLSLGGFGFASAFGGEASRLRCGRRFAASEAGAPEDIARAARDAVAPPRGHRRPKSGRSCPGARSTDKGREREPATARARAGSGERQPERITRAGCAVVGGVEGTKTDR